MLTVFLLAVWWPLLEANPGRARLRFPEDILRPGERLTFINSDENRIDPELTRVFTEALTEAGFDWPVQATFGRVSILKAFDAGYFLLDSAGELFQLRRLDGAPQVTPVPLPEGLAVRHLKVAENKRGEYLGLVLGEDDRLFLLDQDADQRIAAGLTPLALPGYDPETMALKIMFNPLYRTAIYSDQREIKAVAMDQRFQPIARYARIMAMAEPRLVDQVWEALVPFSLDLHDPNGRYVRLGVAVHGLSALPAVGIALSMSKSCRGRLTIGRPTPGLVSDPSSRSRSGRGQTCSILASKSIWPRPRVAPLPRPASPPP